MTGLLGSKSWSGKSRGLPSERVSPPGQSRERRTITSSGREGSAGIASQRRTNINGSGRNGHSAIAERDMERELIIDCIEKEARAAQTRSIITNYRLRWKRGNEMSKRVAFWERTESRRKNGKKSKEKWSDFPGEQRGRRIGRNKETQNGSVKRRLKSYHTHSQAMIAGSRIFKSWKEEEARRQSLASPWVGNEPAA